MPITSDNCLQVANPDRKIVADIVVPELVDVDVTRVAQLFSNLLANALTHGDPQQPVRVRAGIVDGAFELSVANGGAAIPAAQQASLFEPFARPNGSAGRQGLGLGLYIASQIAAAHGGQIEVTSTDGETRFTLTIPTR